MAIFCTQCGFQNADDVIFCGKCGQKQGEPIRSQAIQGSSDSSLAVVTVVASLFIPILFPLIMWLTQRGQNKKVEDIAKEVLNLQLNYIVGLIAIDVSLLVLSLVAGYLSHSLGAFFGVALIGLVNVVAGITYLVLMVIAAVKVSKDELYRFPFIVRLIR